MFKHIMLFCLPLCLAFVACEADQNTEEPVTDEAFIEAIVTDPAAEIISFAELPADVAEDVLLNDFETFVEYVEHVPEKGYICHLANGEIRYYSKSGRPIEYTSVAFSSRIFGSMHPHGRCFRRLRRIARRLPPAELSTTITDYITENYPDREIRGAKELGDSTLVLIQPATVLLFGAADEFLNEWNPLEHCTDRCGPIRPEIRAIVNDYLAENYSEYSIGFVCRRINRIFVSLTNADGRLIVIFVGTGIFIDE
ncbi:MAG: hypothetical protein AAFU67_00705, partial [Bacteroidota bacterium]